MQFYFFHPFPPINAVQPTNPVLEAYEKDHHPFLKKKKIPSPAEIINLLEALAFIPEFMEHAAQGYNVT